MENITKKNTDLLSAAAKPQLANKTGQIKLQLETEISTDRTNCPPIL